MDDTVNEGFGLVKRLSWKAVTEIVVAGALVLHGALMVGYAAPELSRPYRALLGPPWTRGSAPGGADEFQGMLEWMSARIPVRSAVMLFNQKTLPEGYFALYYRASYSLYPRTVWWGTPLPRVSVTDWHVQVPLQAEGFWATLGQYGVKYLLIEGMPPSEVPLQKGIEVERFDREQQLYLVEVPMIDPGR